MPRTECEISEPTMTESQNLILENRDIMIWLENKPVSAAQEISEISSSIAAADTFCMDHDEKTCDVDAGIDNSPEVPKNDSLFEESSPSLELQPEAFSDNDVSNSQPLLQCDVVYGNEMFDPKLKITDSNNFSGKIFCEKVLNERLDCVLNEQNLSLECDKIRSSKDKTIYVDLNSQLTDLECDINSEDYQATVIADDITCNQEKWNESRINIPKKSDNSVILLKIVQILHEITNIISRSK